MRIDVLTTSAHPEMVDFCRWMFSRQRASAEIQHFVHVSSKAGDKEDRSKSLREMLQASEAEFFFFADDDDYVAPDYIGRCLDRIGDAMLYGEIPSRSYLMNPPAYGHSIKRKKLFSTFVLFRREIRSVILRCLETGSFDGALEGQWSHAGNRLIIMRGLMQRPEESITARKNRYAPQHWPYLDFERRKLCEWLEQDPEALDRYLRFAA